jgi:hypothetical protein
MKTVRRVIEWIDGVLDRIPSYEGGRWYRNGGWGCRWRLSRLWYSERDDA